jgi:hypothetical protein
VSAIRVGAALQPRMPRSEPRLFMLDLVLALGTRLRRDVLPQVVTALGAIAVAGLTSPEPLARSKNQPRPRRAVHSAPARLAASTTRAASSGLFGTGNDTYVPRPPPVGRP